MFEEQRVLAMTGSSRIIKTQTTSLYQEKIAWFSQCLQAFARNHEKEYLPKTSL
jgi:hypothetical protein